jgi:hypothetical protein
MKFLTIVRPGPMPPPSDVVRASQEWVNEKLDDGTFECVYSFLEGGGFSVGIADSLEEQMDLMQDYPLAPLVDFEVHPLVEANDGFERALAMIERAAEQMSQA